MLCCMCHRFTLVYVYRRLKFERSAEFPAMEAQLHKEFRELRQRGITVKGWCFKSRAKQILESSDSTNSFKYSEGWFFRFKSRYRISLCRPTNTAQRQPDEKEALQEFHRQIRECQLSESGDGPQEEQFQLHQIANVDQPPHHLLSLVVQPMRQQIPLLSGYVVHHLDLTNVSVPCSSPFLPMESPGSSHYSFSEGPGSGYHSQSS